MILVSGAMGEVLCEVPGQDLMTSVSSSRKPVMKSFTSAVCCCGFSAEMRIKMGEGALCLTLKIHDKVFIPTHPTIIHTREKSGPALQNSLNAANSRSQHKTLRISFSYFSGRGTARSRKPHSQSSYHWWGRNGTFQVPIIAIFSVRDSFTSNFSE